MKHLITRVVVVVSVIALGGACAGSSGGGQDARGSTTVAPTTATEGPATGPPVASPGCGASTTGSVDAERRTVDVDGTERWYLLTTPAEHDGETPLPVVIDFHGILEGAEIHAQMSQYGALAQEEGFVAVIPNGSGDPVRWDANPESDPNQDLAFVDALVETLGDELCIDTSRVYATGLSYGAIMTSFLICTRADKFAAFAPVAGITVPEPCDPSRPVPILTFHGTDDPILSFNGGVGDLSIITGGDPNADATTAPPSTAPAYDLNGEGYPARVAEWAARNGCDPEPTDEQITQEVIHRVYDCPPGADVEFYIILGGGHSWPSSEFSKSIESVVGYTTFDVDATRAGWEFFQRFQLP